MLVLSRKPSEALMIGDDIVVIVKDIRGSSRVSIGIQAPPDKRVRRISAAELEELRPSPGESF